MKTLRIEKNIQPILNVTKNMIKKSDDFNGYYLHEDNNLYQNQLPLLMRRSRIREVLIFKRMNKEIKKINEENNNLPEEEDENEEKKIDYSKLPLSNIRNLHVRSKKLPPLCPFYNKRGELLPKVVSTSKASNKNYIGTEGNSNINASVMTIGSFSKFPKRLNKSPFNSDKKDLNKSFEIDFDDFEKEILYESNYKDLHYNNSDIFGHKDFYEELITGLVEEIKILNSEEAQEDENRNENEDMKSKKLEKIFEWGKNKREIILTLNSLTVKIKEISEEDANKKDLYCFDLSI